VFSASACPKPKGWQTVAVHDCVEEAGGVIFPDILMQRFRKHDPLIDPRFTCAEQRQV